MLLLRLSVIALLSLILSACASSPVVQLYDGPKQADSRVLTLQVPSELEVLTINGKEVEGVNTFFATDYKALKLAPGRYEILAYYKELWQLDADNHEIVKSNPANFVIDGKPGELWVLGFDQPQDVREARALQDSFSGWVENPASGEKHTAEQSELILKRGLMAPITGEQVTTPSSNSVAPQRTAAPMEKADATTPSAAPASYLDTLKAQWNQATAEERRAFLQWIAK